MQAYHTLSRILTFNNADQKAWWDKAAPLLSKALQNAGSDIDAQYHHLGMLHKCVLPYLGTFPRIGNDEMRWKSSMNPYGVPFEPSLNLSQGTVRFAFEPVGPHVGTAKDPQNMNVLWECLDGLVRYEESIGTIWFRNFASRLLLTQEESQQLAATGNYTFGPGQGLYGLAVDLRGLTPMFKGYFWAIPKSKMSGISTNQLIYDAIRDVDTEGTISEPLAIVQDYAEQNKNTLNVGFMSFDMVDSRDARIKIYGVDQKVSFARIEDLWTMGGRIDNRNSQEGLKMLRQLWDLLQIPPGVRTGDVEHLPLGEPPKSMIPTLVNWALLPDHSDPLPQIYLLPFGMQDLHIANALTMFFERIGWTELARDYKKNLASYFPDKDLSHSYNLHGGVSFSFRKGKPYLSVYLSLF